MDLSFFQEMLQYQIRDPHVAKAVINKMLGHTWYLNQVYAPFFLFSHSVDDAQKSEIALKLSKLTSPKRYD